MPSVTVGSAARPDALERMEVSRMAHLVAGTVLTCAHEHCACRVRIESECDCEGATEGSHYTCACGAPMVVVEGN